MTDDRPLTAEGRDVVVEWLVAGALNATVNTEAEREAFWFVTSGRAEAALAAARASDTALRHCYRYFGSDGTLCAQHHGRFASPSEMRCDVALASPEEPR